MNWLLTSLKKGTEWLSVGGAIFGVMWYFGEPRAQDYIQGTVEDRIGGVEQKVDNTAKEITDKIDQILGTVGARLADENTKDAAAAQQFDERLEEQEDSMTIVKDDLDEVQADVDTIQKDIKAILGGIKQLNEAR